jgi:hypothetical protein
VLPVSFGFGFGEVYLKNQATMNLEEALRVIRAGATSLS